MDIIEKQPMNMEMEVDEDGETILKRGEFLNDETASYQAWQMSCICCLSISLIPCLPFVPCCLPALRRSAEERELILTDTNLKFKANSYCCIPPFCFGPCLIKTQTATKIVPLEKITDLNISQGFLQRKLGVEEVGLQTASSSPQRPEFALIGLKDAKTFRRIVLEAKNAGGPSQLRSMVANMQNTQQQQQANNLPPSYTASDPSTHLKEISQTLTRIEALVSSINSAATSYQKLKQNE